MNAENVQDHFLRHLAARGESVPNMTPARALECALAFYLEVRAEGCDLGADQDMLLFQWGTYDWGNGDQFEFDITRQFMFGDGEDEDIWQLHLTIRFEPGEDLARLGRGHRWCSSLEQLPDFARFVREHPAIVAVGTRTDGLASLEYECAG